MKRRQTPALLLGLLLACDAARAGTNSAAKPASPLAGLPGPPGPHIDKIHDLGDNEWVDLGPPAADPAWGLARGRAWGARSLRGAPALRGAFYCGTGVHGFVKPDGHYMDDLWFYDIHGHRWICLYPGAETTTLKLRLDEHGFEVNDRGEHIPVSYLSHGYGNMTYDSDLRKLVIIWCQCPWWTKAIPQRWEWLDQQYECVRTKDYGVPGPVIANNKHPLFWDVARGRWERRFVEGPGPAGWAGVAEYIPSLKKTFFAAEGGSEWLYDGATNAWTELKAAGAAPGHNGCYDPRRERIYSAGNARFSWFDLKAATWNDIKAEGQPEDFYSSNGTCMNCDAVNGVIVVHMRRMVGDSASWILAVYDPDANAWTFPEDTFPASVNTKHKGRSCFYDAELNAHFFYLAGDSGNDGVTMLAYRYRRRP